jgi:DNA-directed RNA polymerase subunit RPC12/RpoP
MEGYWMGKAVHQFLSVWMIVLMLANAAPLYMLAAPEEDAGVMPAMAEDLTEHEHDFTMEIDREGATCMNEGFILYQCSLCDETEAMLIPPGHDWVFKYASPATCDEGGVELYRCSICAEDDERYTPALGHDIVYEILMEPTCEHDGEGTNWCTRCVDVDIRVTIPATGHKWAFIATADASCEDLGYDFYECGACFDYEWRNVVPALGHDGQWAAVIEASCENEGYEEYICSRCGDSADSRITPALGHDFQWAVILGAVCEGEGLEEYTCTRCNDISDARITPALGHDWGEWAVTTVAACEAEGEEACICAHDVSHTQTRTVASLGHDYESAVTAPACTEWGYTAYVCVHCGDGYIDAASFVDALGHAWDEGIVAETGGVKVFTCLRCGETRTEPIPNVYHWADDEGEGLYNNNRSNAGSAGGALVISDPEVPLGAFADVAADAWFFGAVLHVFSEGLMAGTADASFSPDSPLTRGMAATILYRLAGSPEISAHANVFTDVEDGAWYADTVNWAASEGLTAGFGGGLFGPEEPVTVEQLAAFLYRMQQFTGNVPPALAEYKQFADLDTASGWALPVLKALAAQGMFDSLPGGRLNPKAVATRAQIAAILSR